MLVRLQSVRSVYRLDRRDEPHPCVQYVDV